MRKSLVFVFFVVGSLLSQSTVAAETWQRVGDNKVVVTIDWCKKFAKDRQEECRDFDDDQGSSPGRITSEDSLVVQVINFNFLSYSLEIETRESEVEAYQYLSGLWDELLGFDLESLVAKGTSGSGDQRIAEWWKNVRVLRQSIREEVTKYKEPYLTNGDLIELGKKRDEFTSLMSSVVDASKIAAFEASTSVEDLKKYDLVNEDHKKLEEALALFVKLSNLSIQGETKVIGKKDAGTKVATTIKASPLTGVTGKPTTHAVDYFVQSRFPLVFHVGVSYSDIDEIDVKQVRGLGGRDLFAEVEKSGGDTGLTAFLSYPLGKQRSDNSKWLASLGTDVDDIGDKIYLGLTYRINERWMITGGGTYFETEEGVSEVTEESNGSSRTLYEITKEDRDWGAFVAISIKLY